MANIFYTGIGSRSTPGELDGFGELTPLSLLKRWGYLLAKFNFTLRSGAADGADYAFENGCDLADGQKEIYLPWKGFNDSKSDLFYIPPEAYEIAGEIYGSKWKYQKDATKKFMARNMMQVAGIGLDEPSLFVLCWTLDGCCTKTSRTHDTGGTGQAIAYADELGIPIFNLNAKRHEGELAEFLTDYLHKTPVAVPKEREEIDCISERRWRQEYEGVFLSPSIEKIVPKKTINGVVLFEDIKPMKTYLLGVDPATGSGEDFSVIWGKKKS